MTQANRPDLESFLKLFMIRDKRELTKYCRSLIIHRRDFAQIVLAAETGAFPYLHQIHQRDFQDETLRLNQVDIRSITANPIGPLDEKGLKAFTKIQQLYKTRRYLVGHMFHTPNFEYWHFFYFDQRDTSHSQNHWIAGPHIHFINYLWPNQSAASIWSQFTVGNPKMSGALHIRFTNDRSRREPSR